MIWRRLLPAVLLTSFISLPLVATAQDDPEEESTPTQEKPKSDQEKWDAALKDLTKTSGEFTLYTRKKEILVELAPSQLDQLFCVQATLNTGFGILQGGDPLNENFIDVFSFHKVDDTSIQLIRPNLNYRWKPNSPLRLASERAFPNAILANFKIEAKNPANQHLLVNITNLFSSRLFRVDEALDLAAPGFSPDPQNNRPLKVKSFPENSIVQMFYHFKKESSSPEESLLAVLMGFDNSQLADDRSLPLTVSYNLWFRKDTGYTARLADPRVGYFTSDYFDVDKLKQVDRSVKLIQRWNLKKANPTAELSEPIKPVVWYLDHSIPQEYKEGVTRGILFWNKAFEKIGIKNAMVVKDAPTDPDWDHADGRFNLVRWTMTEDQTYAVAWLRTDPISGEIMNAAVTVDANYPAGSVTEFREQVLGAKTLTESPDAQQRIENATASLRSKFAKIGFQKHSCSFASELQDRSAEGWAVAQASGLEISEQEYINTMLADLIAHEVGHCLGLRHNFAASLLHPVSDLNNDKLLEKTAIASSVMDYTPINIAAILGGGNTYWNPTIGDYDYWAIEYGYRSLPGKTPEEEKPALQTIAQRSGLPGLLYLTDEDADGVNPLAVRWDLGSDVINYLKTGREASDRLRNYAINKVTQNGEAYTRRNALILRSIRMNYRDAQHAVRMVGGVEFRRHLKGDVGEKPTLQPVSAKTQREAMIYLVETCLLPQTLDIPQDVLLGLSGAPDAGGSDYIAPLRGYISGQQKMILSQLLASDKCEAIAENEFKLSQSEGYKLTDHFNMLMTAVFAEIPSGQSISPLRRDLQKYTISLLSKIVSNPSSGNEDAKLLSRVHLEKLRSQMLNGLSRFSSQDEITRYHLQDSSEQIDRILKRQAVINPY